MSRSGYDDAIEDNLMYGRWRAQVLSAIRGNRGQAFLRELADAMDAMPHKTLIANELIDHDGNCCTIGVVCKLRGLQVDGIDCEDTRAIGNLVGIARQMAAEIEYQNDENGERWVQIRGSGKWELVAETPEQRWQRMRQWVNDMITKQPT